MAKKTILIVDDTKEALNILRDIVGEILGEEDVEILTASSLDEGKKLAEKARTENVVLYAAFIDIELGRDPVTYKVNVFGFELMEALRDVCLVFPMSGAMNVSEYQEKCREIGMEVMVSKPFTFEEIQEFLLP